MILEKEWLKQNGYDVEHHFVTYTGHIVNRIGSKVIGNLPPGLLRIELYNVRAGESRCYIATEEDDDIIDAAIHKLEEVIGSRLT